MTEQTALTELGSKPLLAPWMADWIENRGHWGVVPDDLERQIPFRFESDVDEYISKAIRANAEHEGQDEV